VTTRDLIDALGLPSQARVSQRVAKKLLIDHGASKAGDKTAITNGIQELLWVAALKPNTIGIAEYRDESREYLEIAVMSLLLRPGASASRLVELVHRAIPYPVVLATQQDTTVSLSLAHKRRSAKPLASSSKIPSIPLDWFPKNRRQSIS
jgi:hypothetical protein